MSFFVDDLEDRCRRIVRNLKKYSSERTPAVFLIREIAVTLDQLDLLRRRQRDLGKRYVNKELYLDTQIMNLRNRPSLTNNWFEHVRLRNEYNRMLDRAERHAQQLAIECESELRQLQVRLLELLNMYDQLSPNNGDSKDSTKA